MSDQEYNPDVDNTAVDSSDYVNRSGDNGEVPVVSDGAAEQGDLGDENAINAPTGNEDSVSGNQISGQELDGVSTDNIIEGERSTRGSDFNKADREADAAVSEATGANPDEF